MKYNFLLLIKPEINDFFENYQRRFITPDHIGEQLFNFKREGFCGIISLTNAILFVFTSKSSQLLKRLVLNESL